jgi:serine protease inhibitor
MECKWWTGREHVRVAFFLVALALTALPVSSAQEKFAAKPATDVQALVQGNNEFAFDLYARLADKKGNVFFSPYSISNALAITYAGARGETASQMAKTLHFTLDQDRLHAAFADLIGQLSGEKKEEKARP